MATVRQLTTRFRFSVENIALTKLQNNLNSIKTTLLGFGAITGLMGAGVVGLLKFAGEAEANRVSFETMLGSADKAREALKKLNIFAASTPFTIPEIEATGKQLLAARVTVEELVPTLKSLGDVASGVNVPLSQVTKNFVQIKAQGKLTGRELRDFLLAGIPLIQELGKNLGKSDAEISQMVSRGSIGFKDVEHAFQTMSGEGGLFFNLMDKQSHTLFGVFSNLKDILILLARTLGGMLLPDVKNFVVTMREWLVVNQKMIQTKFGLVITQLIGLLKDLLQIGSAMLKVFKSVSRVFGGWENSLRLLLQGIAIFLAFKLTVLLGSIAQGAFFAATGFRAMAAAIFTVEFAIGALLVLMALAIEDFIVWQRGGHSVLGVFLNYMKKIKEEGGLSSLFAEGAIEVFDKLAEAIKELNLNLEAMKKFGVGQTLKDTVAGGQKTFEEVANDPNQPIWRRALSGLDAALISIFNPASYAGNSGKQDFMNLFAPTINITGVKDGADAAEQVQKVIDDHNKNQLLQNKSNSPIEH